MMSFLKFIRISFYNLLCFFFNFYRLSATFLLFDVIVAFLLFDVFVGVFLTSIMRVDVDVLFFSYKNTNRELLEFFL